LGFTESMQLIKLLGSEKVQYQEASQPKQWQLKVAIWGCFQFLKDWCAWRIGHHVTGRRETVFYPMVGKLMQKAASQHVFCSAVSKATQLPGYGEDPSDQLSTWSHRSHVLRGFQRSAISVFIQSLLSRWLELFSDMGFSLWTTQMLQNTASNS